MSWRRSCQSISLLAGVTDDADLNILDWWMKMETKTPSWFMAFRIIMAIEPSSAETERMFSLMRNTWGDKQLTSLRDYIESGMMLRYKLTMGSRADKNQTDF